jgi:two-component system, OmpR family, alkaline phosphatase synthesis response regulator PhoP
MLAGSGATGEVQMPEKILIVDDDENARAIVQMLLEDQGYDILIAADGKTAIQLVKEGKPDLVLLDVMMPGMNGYQVCEQIKKDPMTRHIPVIMITAKDMGEDVEMAISKEVDWYIAKPYDNKYLLSKIRSFLGKAE